MSTISLDTETTGVDLHHGARPFLVTVCDESGTNQWWEWEVNPQTRKVEIEKDDLEEIQNLIDDAATVVLQNAKFDVKMLQAVGVTLPYEKIEDTLIASHILSSNTPHDLTFLASQYLRTDIASYETNLQKLVEECRRKCRSQYPDWKIAKKDLTDNNGGWMMPSAKEKVWKFDLWLPAALAKRKGYEEDHFYHTVTADYANTDSSITLALWRVMEPMLGSRKLWKIYRERMKLLRSINGMEECGVTVSMANLRKVSEEFHAIREQKISACESLAKFNYDYDLTLPKSGNSKNLLEFCFGRTERDEDGKFIRQHERLNLPAMKLSEKTGNPSLDKECIEAYLTHEGLDEDQLFFVKELAEKRKLDTALSYLEGYTRFMLPMNYLCQEPGEETDWYVLYPTLNPTGTHTLRFSCQNPNAQNISKISDYNLRQVFGPPPGWEWWALDYQNIELRIPAYAANEPLMIELFEKPNEGPYYGSYHLLIAHILHKEKFEACRNERGEIDGRIFKDGNDKIKGYADTWYQWVKNGNFAFIYGAGETKCDSTYRVHGAYQLIRKKLSGLAKLNDQAIADANKYGYVETLPDRTVDAEHGYPLMCTRTDFGGVLTTTPLNYKVQGTAMWCTSKAMVRCHNQLNKWRKDKEIDAKMILQVHDELLFAFPRGGKRNLPYINRLKKLMEKSGEDIGVPLPVSIGYHPNNWAEKEKV